MKVDDGQIVIFKAASDFSFTLVNAGHGNSDEQSDIPAVMTFFGPRFTLEVSRPGSSGDLGEPLCITSIESRPGLDVDEVEDEGADEDEDETEDEGWF